MAKKNTSNTNTNSSNFTKTYLNMVLANNPFYTAADEQQLVKDLKKGRVVVLTKDMADAGIEASWDETVPTVTFEVAGTVVAEIDFARAFVGRKIKKSFQASGSAANTGRTQFQPNGQKTNKAGKPQAKTYGKNDGRKVAGAAANTATAAVNEVAEDDLVTSVAKAMKMVFGDKAAKPTEKVEKAAAKELTQMDYERLLIKEIIRINRMSDLEEGGIRDLRVPKHTTDGSSWELIDRTNLTWTFRNKIRKNVPDIEISIMDVQCAPEYGYLDEEK